MSGANPSCVYDADFEEIGDQRHGGERRKSDRRAARAHFDTLFAAILVNHVVSRETTRAFGYRPPQRLRPGIAFDLRA
jgi:hypothetical protein